MTSSSPQSARQSRDSQSNLEQEQTHQQNLSLPQQKWIDQPALDDCSSFVEAQDLETDTEPTSLLMQILSGLNPNACLAEVSYATSSYQHEVSCHNPLFGEPDLLGNVEKLLLDVQRDIGNKYRTIALQRLYRLTDREHRQNRYVTIEPII